MLESFPYFALKWGLNYGIGIKQFVIYIKQTWQGFLFLSSHFLFMLPYLVLQWPCVFHYKAKFNCRSK